MSKRIWKTSDVNGKMAIMGLRGNDGKYTDFRFELEGGNIVGCTEELIRGLDPELAEFIHYDEATQQVRMGQYIGKLLGIDDKTYIFRMIGDGKAIH